MQQKLSFKTIGHNNGNWHRLFYFLTRKIIRFRWQAVLLIVLLTAFFAYQMQGLFFDNSNDIWFVKGDRTLEIMDKFKATFGNDEFVFILFDTKDFFQPDTIRRIGRLADDLETHVPYVKDMTWLGNVEHIEGVKGGVEINDLIENIPDTAEEMAKTKEKALNEKTWLNNLISPDGLVAGLILEMDSYPEDRLDPRNEVALAVKNILAKSEHRALKAYVVGEPILHHDYNELANSEAGFFFGICLLIQMGILFWVARGVRGIVVPLVIVVLSVLWTMGMIGVMGLTLNLFIILVPTLLICVGIGDSMHFISEFQDQCIHGLKRRQAVIEAVARVGLPCLITSLTTAIGFLSFLSTRIKPFREMGIYAAIGVMAAFVLTLILVPVFYSFGKDQVRSRKISDSHRVHHDFWDRILEKICRIVIGYPKTVLLMFICLSIVSVIGYQSVEVETNTAKMLSRKLPIRQAYDYVDDRMGGSMSLEVMLNTGKKDGVKDPVFLKQMDTFQQFMEDHPLTTKTSSVLDILKKMRRALHENKSEYYGIPETKDGTSQYLFLYETSGGENLDKLVSFDYDIARLTARTKTLDTKDVRRFITDVKDFAQKNFGPAVKVEVTGYAGWFKKLNDLVGEGQKQSFITALIVITLVLIVVMGSLRLGLISMVPNVFPVLITLGLMGFAGIYMDTPLMSFSAVIIGVAVDDTIHFMMRFRREFERLGNYADSLRTTLSTAGRPVTFTTITLVLGFSVLAFSNVSGIAKYGLLSSFAFLWALLADFFFMPAFLLLLKPLGPERRVKA
jgi:hydrophobe/amphiphile efflux-3 (HAE3) family protein